MAKNHHTHLDSNEAIRDSIQKIALHGFINRETGAIRNVGNIVGYVAKIHTEGDLKGTIDVQEYIKFDEDQNVKVGYHEGVLVSVVKSDNKGMLIMPKLYSDVVISIDPETKDEYVSMFSHVDVIQLDSHDTIIVGVKEREEFDDTSEDTPDVDELEETGVFSQTTYVKNSIVTEVQGEGSGDFSKHTINDKTIKSEIGDDKSSVSLTKDEVCLKHNKAKTILDNDSHTSSFGNSKVQIKDGTVYVGSDTNTDDAVLGVELANILSEMLGYIGQIMTPTALGPQPPANIASFIALKAKIDSFKAAHSGFLTKKVKIQK